jgi:hypothetical protein
MTAAAPADPLAFFLKHAHPDNPEYCAELARAESWLVSQPGFQVEWVNDPHYNPKDYDVPMPRRGWGCIVTVRGESQSLWGITFKRPNTPDGDTYSRVVVAELASELMP